MFRCSLSDLEQCCGPHLFWCIQLDKSDAFGLFNGNPSSEPSVELLGKTLFDLAPVVERDHVAA